ncbi:hypothetical protein ACLOJK_034385 [Asimina triloba]
MDQDYSPVMGSTLAWIVEKGQISSLNPSLPTTPTTGVDGDGFVVDGAHRILEENLINSSLPWMI